MRKTSLVVGLLLCLNTTMASQIETTTSENGTKTRWTLTTIGENDILRVDEGGWSSSVSMSAAATAGSGAASVHYEKGPTQGTMIHDPNLGEIMMLEGEICRVLSKSSAAPPGMDFMNSPEMKEHQSKMAGAMADAMAQMEQSGMSQSQIDAMGELLGGVTMTEPPRDATLQVEAEQRNVSVGQFSTDVYVARTTSGAESNIDVTPDCEKRDVMQY